MLQENCLAILIGRVSVEELTWKSWWQYWGNAMVIFYCQKFSNQLASLMNGWA